MTHTHLSRWEVIIRRVGNPSDEIIPVNHQTLVGAYKLGCEEAEKRSKTAFKVLGVVEIPFSELTDEENEDDGA